MTSNPCDCSDCTIYSNNDKPIQGKNVTDELFNKTLSICQYTQVKEIMKMERYKSIIYELVPYDKWKDLQNKEIYQSMVDKLKITKKIPDEDPEICAVNLAFDLDSNCDITVVSYRFPTSTVKYTLSIYNKDDKVKLKTGSRGSEYCKK